MMYTIEYLPTARKDIKEITGYIAFELFNPDAAERLVRYILKAVNSLSETPYKYPEYYPTKSLDEKYRRIVVRNYDVFYYVDEDSQKVVVSRVIYAGRDIDRII